MDESGHHLRKKPSTPPTSWKKHIYLANKIYIEYVDKPINIKYTACTCYMLHIGGLSLLYEDFGEVGISGKER